MGRLATRFNRLALYSWDLMIWSRIEAARVGIVSLVLPPSVLARKSIHHGPPSLRVRSPRGEYDHFNEAFAAVYVILFGNLQGPDILSDHRYALPGPAFRGIYLWDSAFIAQVWRLWDRKVAGEVLTSVVSLRDGDRLQHFVDDFLQSEYTQPPLLAWSLAEWVRTAPPSSRNEELVGSLYPALCAYHRWLHQYRRTTDGLYAWQHPYESGIDNSPRFSTRAESRFERTVGVAAPDFCAYMVLHAESLASLAEYLELPSEAEDYHREAELLRAQVNERLWCEEDGMYHDFDSSTGQLKRCRTIAGLLPLWAGIPDQRRARRMRDVIMEATAFSTLIPLPSVPLDEPVFERDMWRGPVWINTAYGVICGLRRYGFEKEAAELAWRMCDGVYHVFQRERQVYEFYDPEAWHTRNLRRKRGNLWKLITLGGGPQREFVGWSGLVNTLLIEVIFGLEWHHGRRLLTPRFPDCAIGSVFRLALPSEGLVLEVALENENHLQGFVQRRDGLRTFQAQRGETVRLDALFDLTPSTI